MITKSLALLTLFCLGLIVIPKQPQISTESASSVSVSSDTERFSSQYDDYFIQYTRRYLNDWDWLWLKAQCYQESLLDPLARSNAGAVGLCQFLKGTWGDCQKALKFVGNRTSAHLNSRCAGWYMRQLARNFDRRGRGQTEIRENAQASYNTGLGNVLKAQRKCNDARDWPKINPCLIDVTGPDNSHETITYVSRIARWFREMTV